MKEDIIVIADTQVDENSPLSHLRALGRYVWEHKPRQLVHIGDHWDFPSLSSYASILEKEGRYLVNDLNSGLTALEIITAETDRKNASAKKKPYMPAKDFIMGNHEYRLIRYLEANPILLGSFDISKLIEGVGWNVHEFLKPFWVDDICFIHYMPAAASGRPVGGGIENKLNKFPHSFVHGHQQQFQFGRRQNLEGRPHFGACAGSFYLHDESYRGANNTEIRGFLHLKAFTNRYGFLDYDVEFVSLERLLEQYGE
tara:strand:- start:6005 stop:6772 length:768 start_codon:yes stop_codon:yes gene_type:complete